MFTRCHLSSDEAYCEALGLWSDLKMENSMARHVAAAKQGTLRYDGNVAQSCLDTLTTAGCNTWQGSPDGIIADACRRMFSGGATKDGASCIVDLECTPGSACVYESGCDTGVCANDSDYQCLSAEQCPTNSVCKYLFCQDAIPRALGQDCDGGNLPCQAGLFCGATDASSSSAALCYPLLGEGSPCTSINDCADGLICLQIGGTGGATCLRIAAKGESCQQSGQCGGVLMSTLTCDLTAQVCVDMPSSGPCGDEKLFGTRCDIATSYCGGSTDSPTCLPLSTKTTVALGEACGFFAIGTAECDSSTYCEFSGSGSSGTCVPQPTCAH